MALRDGATFRANIIAHNAGAGLILSTRAGSPVTGNDMDENGWGAEGSAVAEANDWGDPTGPLHASINPGGLGNEVRASGESFDFLPFATKESMPHIAPPRPPAPPPTAPGPAPPSSAPSPPAIPDVEGQKGTPLGGPVWLLLAGLIAAAHARRGPP